MIFYQPFYTLLTSSQVTTSIRWLCYCTVHVYIVIHFSDCVWSFEWKRIYGGVFLNGLFLYVFSLEIQLSDGKSLDHSSGVKPATFFACPKTWIPNTECLGLFVIIGLKWQVVVRCIDIYRIVDHSYLNFLFISYWKLLNQGFLVVKLKSSLRKIYGDISAMTCLTVTEYLCQKLPRICSVCRNHNPVRSSFMDYDRICSS
jgi:hypothetical protein